MRQARFELYAGWGKAAVIHRAAPMSAGGFVRIGAAEMRKNKIDILALP